MERRNGRVNVSIRSTATSKSQRLTFEKERDITGCVWKGNDCLVYQQDAGGDQGAHFYRLDLRPRPAVMDLTPWKNVTAALLDDLNGVAGADDEVLIQLMRGKRRLFDVYRVNIRTGRSRMVAKNPGTVRRWIVDNSGCVRAGIGIDGTNDCLLVRPDERSPFCLARGMDFRRSINRYTSLFFTPDNQAIFALSRIDSDRDKFALVTISATTGQELCCLYQPRYVDVENFFFSKARKKITHLVFYDSKLRTKIFDRRTGEVFRALRKKPGLRGYTLELQGHDQVESKFIVLASNDRNPGKVYLFDRVTNLLTKLQDVLPGLEEKQLAHVRPISFRSRDRLTIHGYLTLPRGRKRKNLPVLVNVHGGPEMRDYWQFTLREGAETQFLTSRGYAVLQVNYRGSVGYGRQFWQHGFGERGKKMQDDITDGVNWLINRGIADPDRIAIYGKSYGGYAALVGITFTPDLYKAAIDYAGMSNSATWLQKIHGYDEPLLPQFYVKVGHPRRDQSSLEAAAPAKHAEQIKTPLLIAHGAQDPQVRKSESDQLVAALLAADPAGNLDLQYMVKAKEGHLFQRVENKIEFYTALERFLAKHLG